MDNLAVSESKEIDDSILKPKQRKAPAFTPEQRAAMSERMKKVNASRIANSKSAEQQKVKEQKNLEREQKRLELEKELERLRTEAQLEPPRLQPVPKKKYVRKEKDTLDHDPKYDELIQKVREVKRVQIPPPESDSESEDEPTPPPKTRKPRAVKTQAPAQPEPPRVVCKFL